MMNSNIDKKIKQLKTEDFIWFIYIFIILFSWYSNDLERKFFLFNDLNSRDKYRKVMILIFSVLVVVYFYFLTDAYEGVKNINFKFMSKKDKLSILSFIGSLFVFISGIIFLYIVYVDTSIDVEIAFN